MIEGAIRSALVRVVLSNFTTPPIARPEPGDCVETPKALCSISRSLFAKNDSQLLRCTGVGADIFANSRFPVDWRVARFSEPALTFVPTVCTGTKTKTAIRGVLVTPDCR
jgi:hypothetical protein